MHIAIIGSRNYSKPDLVRAYVAQLPQDTTVVSGGAPGPDSEAEQAAKKRGLPTRIFRADWQRYGKSAGPRRNRQIVSNADRLVAFWDGHSRGTAHSISEAKRQGKPVEIILDKQPEAEQASLW